MTTYWRVKDIPELRGMAAQRQRKLWREAVSRSSTPWRMLGSMALVFVAALLAGSASAILLRAISSLWVVVPAVAVVGFASDLWIRQPAARRWLREHAHELDRYVPA